MRRFFAALGVLVILLSTLAVAPAHAAVDIIKNLNATFDVQADGSLKVTYELDWEFAESGRHGIDFGIASREPWDDDPTQEAVYEISDVNVDSPSGAPDQFTQSIKRDYDGGETTNLRIGDPDKTIDGRRATYVISYVLTGALRTFDGEPQLYWDVNSGTYPAVEQFTLTASAPDGDVTGRCLVGNAECTTTVNGSTATMTGKADAGTVVSVVLGMEPGVVANAEPVLEEAKLYAPVLDTATSTVDVGADGVAHVTLLLAYRFPEGNLHYANLRLLTRRPLSTVEDQVFRVENLGATDATGNAVEPDVEPSPGDRSTAWDGVRLRGSSEGSEETFTITYDVVGAAWSDEDGGHFVQPLVPIQDSVEAGLDARWTFPADVGSVGCRGLSASGDTRSCHLSAEASGDEVRLEKSYHAVSSVFELMEVDVPAAAFPGVSALVEPSRDRARRIGGFGGLGIGIVGAIALIAAGRGIGRLPAKRDQRHDGVAPGLTGSGAVVATSRKYKVPVQFDVPDIPLPVAGLLLDGRFRASHTAAALTQLAVDGHVQLKSKPLSMKKLSDTQPEENYARTIYQQATHSLTPLASKRIRTINRAVANRQKSAQKTKRYFLQQKDLAGATLRKRFITLGIGLPVILGCLALSQTGWGPWVVIPAGFGVVGAIVGTFMALLGVPDRPLAADGTALRDQIRGFRTYIATAEANQLNFEADQDIFRRYLPWAVLFGLTERWTKVCQQLAAAGSIPELDTSFLAGSGSASDLSRGMSSITSTLSSSATLDRPSRGGGSSFWSGSSSSGGSGSSSGFSSGSSGGGGGGGTSSSSW